MKFPNADSFYALDSKEYQRLQKQSTISALLLSHLYVGLCVEREIEITIEKKERRRLK